MGMWKGGREEKTILTYLQYEKYAMRSDDVYGPTGTEYRNFSKALQTQLPRDSRARLYSLGRRQRRGKSLGKPIRTENDIEMETKKQ